MVHLVFLVLMEIKDRQVLLAPLAPLVMLVLKVCLGHLVKMVIQEILVPLVLLVQLDLLVHLARKVKLEMQVHRDHLAPPVHGYVISRTFIFQILTILLLLCIGT